MNSRALCVTILSPRRTVKIGARRAPSGHACRKRLQTYRHTFRCSRPMRSRPESMSSKLTAYPKSEGPIDNWTRIINATVASPLFSLRCSPPEYPILLISTRSSSRADSILRPAAWCGIWKRSRPPHSSRGWLTSAFARPTMRVDVELVVVTGRLSHCERQFLPGRASLEPQSGRELMRFGRRSGAL